MKIKVLLAALLLFGAALSADAQITAPEMPQDPKDMNMPRVRAPEITTRHGWVNTEKAYSLKDFKGKIVLLDFWTFGCINCRHVVPDLERLEKEFHEELVVVGIHSGKFSSEKESDKIRQAALKFGIRHPIVNDADYSIWERYSAKAWPTVTLIDPEGYVIGQRSGEGFYNVVKKNIEFLIEKHKDQINREIIPFRFTPKPDNPLLFPSKLLRSENGEIFISDSGNHRILKVNREGKVLAVIGKGERGFADGSFETVQFNEPHGMAFYKDKLYIADTQNNRIRKVDFNAKTVTTVSGTGELDYYLDLEEWGTEVQPNSPWDLITDYDRILVASAGNHQILKFDPETEKCYRFAGTGHETLRDGPFMYAGFNQPSGLTVLGRDLYVADTEASAVRKLNLSAGKVLTLVGKGLFDFGDKSGPFSRTVLQHPVGITAHKGLIYVADTYNGKIKVMDPKKEKTKLVMGGLNEPNDLIFIDENTFWVSDTNNHRILEVNTESGEQKPLIISFETK